MQRTSLSVSLNNNLPPEWTSQEFKSVIEYHLPYLRDTALAPVPVSADVGWHSRGDFYQILINNGINDRLHWIILRMNNLTNPLHYDGSAMDILIPHEDAIEYIWNMFRTTSI